MGDGIGVLNLEYALGHHTRNVIQDNWKVGAGATATVIPVLSVNPANQSIDITGQVATNMQGARVEFIEGKNIHVQRLVNSATSNGTLTLDTALPYVPAVGDKFIVFQDIHVAVTVSAPENIAQVGGMPQTADDWTLLLRNLEGSSSLNANLKTLTASNTATQLPNVACREVTLIALYGNSVGGAVYVGGSNVAVVSNPTAAPTLSTASTGGTLPAATYYVKFTWVNANGETQASPEASITTTGSSSTITVGVPTFPTGVTNANVYMSTSSGTETKQGSTTTTTYTQSAALVAGSALPVENKATAYGVALFSKDSFTFKVSNVDMLYIYGTAGDGVSYVAV